MSQHLKQVKIESQGEKTGSNAAYCIVEMGNRFPYGELRAVRAELTEILVRKKLICSSKSQWEAICRTACLLRGLKHDFLINFHHMEKESGAVCFYYEYAHLNMEKWVLDLGDDIWEILKNQMLDLAAFLNGNQIFFTFDERCIGLSKDIAVKYFLNEFSIMDAKQTAMRTKNLAYNREKIEKYFADFKEIHEE